MTLQIWFEYPEGLILARVCVGEGRSSIHFRTSESETSNRHLNRDVKGASDICVWCPGEKFELKIQIQEFLIYAWYLSDETG